MRTYVINQGAPSGYLDWDEGRGRLTVAVTGPVGFAKVLPAIKGMPGRIFDGDRKLWLLPPHAADLVLEVLVPLGVSLRPAAETWLAQRSDKVATPTNPDMSVPSAPVHTLGPSDSSVASIHRRVKIAVDEAFSGASVWIAAHLRNWRGPNAKGHCYFTLVDDPKSAQGEEISAVIWSSQTKRLLEIYADRGIHLAEDDKVRLRCKVELYRGKLQLIVEEADPTLTEAGDRIREIRFRQLEKNGLTRLNRERPFPALPLVVGIVSTRAGFGYEDFTKVLKEAGLPFTLIFHPASVQGDTAESEVPAALAALASHGPDVVALIRGGGSASSLACFNALAIGEAIARCAVPVVTGLGHEPDVHLADMVAALPCKTPTDAAHQLVRMAVLARDDLRGRLGRNLQRLGGVLERERGQLLRRRDLIAQGLQREISRQRTLLERTRLLETTRLRLERERGALDLVTARLRSADPDRPLRLGYARLLGRDGKPRTRLRDLALDDRVTLQLTDGTATATITNLHPQGDST
ncbi:MAG: exodeoxyribonuclease VII large subunit [Candidatus Sericytochromatia bacterium]|nr:exodeoxyribonuclease VII large subunit [Candidatus Sericytochromatia bacterium]